MKRHAVLILELKLTRAVKMLLVSDFCLSNTTIKNKKNGMKVADKQIHCEMCKILKMVNLCMMSNQTSLKSG